MVAGVPRQGGATWAVLQYVLGLRELGHRVLLVEPVAASSLVPAGAPLDRSANAAYFIDVAARFDLGASAALVGQDTRETVGLSHRALVDFASQADLLINISGMLTDPAIVAHVPRRVYLDLDPAFNQLWDAVEGVDVRFAGHTDFVTVGTLIGSEGCGVPTCGRSWIPTWQPVVLSQWPSAPGRPGGAWTTVGHWRGYGSIEHRGVHYGQKVHSFRRFMDLPQRTQTRLRPALAIHPGEARDLAALRDNGWHLADPAAVAGTPDSYRRFIQTSKGELGIAKSGYVVSRCGWFSDRSICYLATGRPVVAENTGFADRLPTGEGVFAVSTAEEAAAALETASAGYANHCRRARELADAYFRSDLVLTRLLERLGGRGADETRSDPASLAVGAAVGLAAASGGPPR
jgi:hypothetical protein